MNPKVSILIPATNADRWIAQAIQSASIKPIHKGSDRGG
jgi:hypothetical protein